MKNYYTALAAISLLSLKFSRSSLPINATAFVYGNIIKTSLSNRTPTATQTTAMSGWSGTWKDILNGGNPRWKITCEESHEKAYSHFQRHVLNSNNNDDKKNVSVLCPLAGDDPFVSLLYKKGYNVTAIDLVPEAIDANRRGFGDDDSAWTKTESDGDIVWTHNSGRATLIAGDALKKRPQLVNSFDAVYDKDSFGALPRDLRKPFCERMADYTKNNAIVYLECKLKKGLENQEDFAGPPYSLRQVDLMETNNYGGSKFEYVEKIGPVYDLPGGMNSVMKQTGHILRRNRA